MGTGCKLGGGRPPFVFSAKTGHVRGIVDNECGAVAAIFKRSAAPVSILHRLRRSTEQQPPFAGTAGVPDQAPRSGLEDVSIVRLGLTLPHG